MSKEELGNLTVRYFIHKQKLYEEEERKDRIKEPEKPEGSISFEEAEKIEKSKQEYSYAIKMIDRKISQIKSDINKDEKLIKGAIPTQNAEINVTGNYQSKTYNLVIKHVKNDDHNHIEIKEQ